MKSNQPSKDSGNVPAPQGVASEVPSNEPVPADGGRGRTPAPEGGAARDFANADPDRSSCWNPDSAAHKSHLSQTEIELLERIERRVQAGDFELPQLPSTAQKIMNLAANPKFEMDEVVEVIASDPVLSSEVLKVANSVIYGGRVACESLRDAIMRVGLRGVRSVMLTLSMRSAILRDPHLMILAIEIWRQSNSVAHLARHLADRARIEPESAYLLGLTHDIGKVALLSLVAEHTRRQGQISAAFLGTLFVRFHEDVGSRMAEEWGLPPEIVSVAGCHHVYMRNEQFPREAALVSLAHKIDLSVSQGQKKAFSELVTTGEMDVLGIDEGIRVGLLKEALTLLRDTDRFTGSAA